MKQKQETLNMKKILGLKKLKRQELYTSVRKSYKKKTFNFWRLNKKGNTTILAITLLSTVALTAYLLVMNEIKRSIELKELSETILCIKEQRLKLIHYVKKMEILNTQIGLAKAATIIPQTSTAAKIALNALKISQNIYHYSHLRHIIKFKHCSKIERGQYLTSLPYKMTPILSLKRSKLFDTAIKKGEEWKGLLINKSLKQSFMFNYKFTSIISGEFTTRTQKLKTGATEFLKQSSGLELWDQLRSRIFKSTKKYN